MNGARSLVICCDGTGIVFDVSPRASHVVKLASARLLLIFSRYFCMVGLNIVFNQIGKI